jgi:hypothetical protein
MAGAASQANQVFYSHVVFMKGTEERKRQLEASITEALQREAKRHEAAYRRARVTTRRVLSSRLSSLLLPLLRGGAARVMPRCFPAGLDRTGGRSRPRWNRVAIQALNGL